VNNYLKERKQKIYIFCRNGPRGSADPAFTSRLNFISKLITELLNQRTHHIRGKTTKNEKGEMVCILLQVLGDAGN
jgi:hypothetical protein